LNNKTEKKDRQTHTHKRGTILPQNPSLSNVSCEHTHCPWLQTLFTMTQTPLSRQGPLRRPLATEDKQKQQHVIIVQYIKSRFNKFHLFLGLQLICITLYLTTNL